MNIVFSIFKPLCVAANNHMNNMATITVATRDPQPHPTPVPSLFCTTHSNIFDYFTIMHEIGEKC